MLQAKELSKRYGRTCALDDLTLEIPPGSVMGLLGPNGAGKTTFLRLVMGFIEPDGGQIDRGGLSPSQIGYLPERAFYPPRYRVRGYLKTIGRLAGLESQDLRDSVERLLVQLGLAEAAGQRIGACSRGMLQRMGVAQALLADPQLIVLDEPVLGLDPGGQKFIRDQIVSLNRLGKTVLLSSHNLGEVTRVCTHVAVLDRGRLVRTGPMSSLLPRRAQVVISTGPLSERLASHLATVAPGIAVGERRVILVGDAVLRKPDVLRFLLEAGVDVRELSESHATLEEVFLEATGG
jgi:ABC-2 type transport system ATP-binding protein